MKKIKLLLVFASILTIFASVFTGCNDDGIDEAMSYTDDSAVTSRASLSSGVLWQGTYDVGEEWNLAKEFTGNQFTGATGIKVEFTTNSDAPWWQIKMMQNDASWTPLNIPGADAGVLDVSAGQTSYTFTLDGDNLTNVQVNGLTIGGYGLTLTKVSLVAVQSPGVLWEGTNNIGTEWGLVQKVSGDLFTGATGVKVEFTTNSGGHPWKIKMMRNNYGWIPLDIPGITGGVADVSAGQTSYTFNLTGANLANVRANVLTIGGYGLTLTKVSLVELVAPGVLWQGTNNIGTGWGLAQEFTGNQFTGATGIKVEFTTNNDTYWWQIKMTQNDASWTPLNIPGATGGIADVSATQTSYTFNLTGANLANVRANGLTIGGHALTLTKVSLVELMAPGVLWEGTNNIGTGWNVAQKFSGDLFTGATGVKVEFTTNNDTYWWQIKMMLNNSSWSTLNIPGATGGIADVSATQTSYTFNLTRANLNSVRANGLLIGGHALTLTKVSLVELMAPGVLWEGTNNIGNTWNVAQKFSGDLFTGATGVKVEFTTNNDTYWWQIKMTQNDASWTPLNIPGATGGIADVSATQTSYTFNLTGANLANVRANGLTIGGHALTLTKVTFVPIRGDEVLWEGTNNIGNTWGVVQQVPGSLFTTPTGVKVEFTTNPGAGYWCIKMMYDYSSWIPLDIPGDGVGNDAGVINLPFGATTYTFNLVGLNLMNVRNSELLIGGHGITITKISRVPLI